MKKQRLYIICLLLVCISCSKKASTSSPTITWDGNVVPYAPVAVTKTINNKKVFAHYLPWFQAPFNPVANGSYSWGQHWTMQNENPNVITNGQRQIASYYYPLTGPYESGDTTLIDYQLLLMKLSGIDGVFIDWPGTQNVSDYPQTVANTNVLVSRLSKVGFKYAIVYEDRNLTSPNPPINISLAQTDMNYLQSHYFNDPNYENFSGSPMLLDFGPITLTSSSDWTSAFSSLSPKPSFFTIEYQSSEAGSNAVGEFAWVEQGNISNLDNFYGDNYTGTKISTAYPGFKSFYQQGGWPYTGLTWVVDPSVSTFQQTLTLALQQTNNSYIQLVTWNDYGEGTMIEPTTQFQYGFLTSLQQQLGVQSSLSQTDLQLVSKLYTARVSNTANFNQTNLNELDQVFYDIASLKMDSASALLAKDF